MPIKIPDALPAVEALNRENIFVMTEHRAIHQDIRPLNVLILNLMPTKIVTEIQIMRKLANTPLQIEVELLQTASYIPQHVDTNHLESFYRTFDQVRERTYDGMIITGAPVENLDFSQVSYWDELCQIMEVDPNERPLHPPHLLGRAGGALLSLRPAEAYTAGEAVRSIPAPGPEKELSLVSRV